MGRAHGPFDLVVIADGSASGLRAQVRPRARAPALSLGRGLGQRAGPRRRLDRRPAPALRPGRGDGRRSAGRRRPRWRRAIHRSACSGLCRWREMDAFFAGDFEAWTARVRQVWPAAASIDRHPRRSRGHGARRLPRCLGRPLEPGRHPADRRRRARDQPAARPGRQSGPGRRRRTGRAVRGYDDAVAVTARAYETSRRWHVMPYQFISWALTPLFQSHGRFWAPSCAAGCSRRCRGAGPASASSARRC